MRSSIFAKGKKNKIIDLILLVISLFFILDLLTVGIKSKFLLLFLLFGGGVVFQAILLIKNTLEVLRLIYGIFIISLLLTAVGAIIGAFFTSEAGWSVSTIYLTFSLFSLGIPIIYKEKILSGITEELIFSYTLTFWFVLLIYGYFDLLSRTTFGIYLLLLLLIPTLATFIMAFINFNLKFLLKLFFISWFLIIVIFLLALAMLRHLSLTFNPDIFNPLGLILAGMSTLYLIVFSSIVYDLFPFAHKKEFGYDLQKWKENIEMLITRYSDAQLNTVHALLIILIQGSSYILNYYFNIVPDYLLINFWIIFIPQVNSIFLDRFRTLQNI